jgi:long-chain acyl-CoA synthetase
MNSENDFFSNFKRFSSLPEAFFDICEKHPRDIVFTQAVFRADKLDSSVKPEWQSVSYQDTKLKVLKVAEYLKSLGVKQGDKVAIVSFTRPEWMIADLAILAVGAVSVSIYQSVNREETGYILHDSQADIVFAENEEQLEKLLSLHKKNVLLPPTELNPIKEVSIELKRIITFEKTTNNALVVALEEILSDQSLGSNSWDKEIDLNKDSLASFVYTSGTTGAPKGVVQTHGNHLANIWQAAHTGLFAPSGDIFLYLPLAHSFARLIGYIGFLTLTKLNFPSIPSRTTSVLNPVAMLRDLRESNSEVIPTVPRMLEKMQSGILSKKESSGLGAKILRLTLDCAKKRFEAKKNNQSVPFAATLGFMLTRSIRTKIKKSLFGNKFSHLISGGAKLPVNVAEFFAALEINVYEGYGLTETCVATNVNLIGKNKIGSVGPAMKEVELRIADDGEILFKGPNITKGYYNRPQATAASWDNEGWFHTGDIGKLDEDGYLYITGRKKELIVTAGGKKIAPAPIEEKLQASPYVSYALVFGEGQSHCVAGIILDKETVSAWVKQQRLTLAPVIEETPQVIELIKAEVDKVNASLSRHEVLKKFAILTIEPSVENGLLTPSFKLKKNAVYKQFAAQIDSLYVG